MTAFFKILKIMPLKVLFKFCTLKLLLKTLSNEFLMFLKPKHSYNRWDDDLEVQKSNNNWGERSLLCSGVSLYNKHQKGVRIGARAGFSLGSGLLTVGAEVATACEAARPRASFFGSSAL